MGALAIQKETMLADVRPLSMDLYYQFVNYLDASPRTVESYSKNVKQFFKYLASRGIMQPTRETVLEYKEWLKADRKPTTVQNYITSVRIFFTWAEGAGLYPNIADHVKGAKLDKNHKKDYFTSRQVKKVLSMAKAEEGIQGLRNYAILALMFTGGLRTIEVSRANIEDLRTAGNSAVLYIQGKGHEEKTDYVKLAPEVEDAIRAYLKARGTCSLNDPLFVSTSNNSKGKAMTTRSISGLVKKAFINAGYDSEKYTAHSTRHTAVTLALMGGEKLEAVKNFARHKNIETTLIYAHNVERAKLQCEATIAKAIF